MAQVSTAIHFKCPVCHQEATVEVKVPEVDYSCDRLSDSLTEDDIDFECPQCHVGFGAHVQNSPSHCAVELYDYPEVKVSADDAPFPAYDADDDWLNLDSPDDPLRVFMDSYHRLGDIVTEYGVGGRGTLPHSSEVINRMVYASAIAAMEAFLGDVLINAVLSEEVALKRLIEKDSELKKVSIPLADILAKTTVVIDTAREYLAGLLYHNLAKVGVLYKLILEVEILPDPEHKARLMRAVSTRHDIVHRNGKDKFGQEVELPTAAVFATLADVRRLVEYVDKGVEAAMQKIRQAKVAMPAGKD